jgi:hypothetical protein
MISFYIGPFLIQTERIDGLYFDGRKDRTNILSDDHRQSVKSEEHIAVVAQPGNRYIDHVSPEQGDAQSITDAILDITDLTDVVAIGCDGTATNTGWKSGVIRRLEVSLNRPLHWFVCLLHANELPLRHLVCFLDGVTSGPNSFTGMIGKALFDWNKPVIKFETMDTRDDVLVGTYDDLSTDQSYLLDIIRAVNTGEVSDALAARQPGKMNHARWLTLASRILRLYISSPSPSPELLHLVKYVMLVYGPVWFAVKRHHGCHQGSKILFLLANYSRNHAPSSPQDNRSGYPT